MAVTKTTTVKRTRRTIPRSGYTFAPRFASLAAHRRIMYGRRPTWSARAKRRGTRMMYARTKRRAIRMPRFLLAQIDPFSRDAMHVRVPDDSTAPSSSFYAYDELNLAANNAIIGGAAAFYFYPNPLCIGAQANSATASSWTWAANYGGTVLVSKTTAIRAQYTLSRPVAHGIRITCGMAPTSVTGYCHIGLYSLSLFNQPTWKLPTSIADLSELPHYRRVTLASLTQTPLVVCNKFLDPTAFRYTDTGSFETVQAGSAIFQVANSWMGIIVIVEGHGQIVGAPVVTVETICHFEGQSGYGGLTQDGPAESPRPAEFAATAETVATVGASHADDPAGKSSAVNEAAQCFAENFQAAVNPSIRNAARSAGAAVGSVIGSAIAGTAFYAFTRAGAQQRRVDAAAARFYG